MLRTHEGKQKVLGKKEHLNIRSSPRNKNNRRGSLCQSLATRRIRNIPEMMKMVIPLTTRRHMVSIRYAVSNATHDPSFVCARCTGCKHSKCTPLGDSSLAAALCLRPNQGQRNGQTRWQTP